MTTKTSGNTACRVARLRGKGKLPAFYVPVNLNPKRLPPGQRQFAAYLLNLLHWKWICWKADEHGFINLKAEYVTRVIPPAVWSTLWKHLETLGVIETDGKICAGGKRPKCRGYRIASRYRKTRRIQCSNKGLARRIRNVCSKESVPRVPVHRWLKAHLERVHFNLGLAEAIMETMEPDEGSLIPLEDYRDLLRESCLRISNGDFFLECDRFGRVHTNITSLAKQLRPCLRIEGQSLVGLDLANSQPLIAGIVARLFYQSRMARTRLRQRNFRMSGNPYHRRQISSHEPYADSPDLDEYLNVCEFGRLYETLRRPDQSREQVKRQFLTVMYSKNHWKSPMKDHFASKYPSIANMLAFLKSDDYRHASHVIQNVEATIFIHRICSWLQRERPDLPIVTIHDSIATIPAAIAYVENVIRDEFRHIGIKPTLKKEDYSAEA